MDFLWVTKKLCFIFTLLFFACNQFEFEINCRVQIVNVLLETASFRLMIISEFTLIILFEKKKIIVVTPWVLFHSSSDQLPNIFDMLLKAFSF